MNTKFFIAANLLFASHHLFSSVDSCLHHLPLRTVKKSTRSSQEEVVDEGLLSTHGLQLRILQPGKGTIKKGCERSL